MAETKSLCAKISVKLHEKVTQTKDESGLTLNEYVEQLITEYYEMKERTPFMATRTLAFQISEELFTRIKKYVDRIPHLTQKAFMTELITKALDELEQAEDTNDELLDREV